MKKSIRRIQNENIPATAATYAEVFAGPPWFEVSRCTKCGNFSGEQPENKTACACGGVLSRMAYPAKETQKYIVKELGRPNAVGLLLAQLASLQVAAVDGFSWGFGWSTAELAQQKYRSEQVQQLIRELLVASNAFFYISEVGVLPRAQGLGLGKRLTQRLISAGEKRGYGSFVARTNEDSPMRYILAGMGMKPVIGLDSGVRDAENEARVLFVGEK